jgi:hypothetical protein
MASIAASSGCAAGGVDEIDYDKLTTTEMRKQWREARGQAGTKYIAAPGCSFSNSSTPEELARFSRSLEAKSSRSRRRKS